MSGVVISKSPSVVVAPSPSETVIETGDISLSGYDKMFGPMRLTALFVFEHAIQEPVETVRRGLSQALVHYYPMAGRFGTARANPEEVVIKCTGEGVTLVAASANCAIKDVQSLSDASLHEELAIFYPAATTVAGRYSEVHPFVSMQVTVFSCGGFVLGVTWSHAVADGVGIGQFVQAVGELARGLPSPSVVPVRPEQDDGLLRRMLDQLPPYPISFCEYMGHIQLPQMEALDITLKPSLINSIKHEYASMNSGQPCTVFEAVAAVLWLCRTRAICCRSSGFSQDPEALAVLTFSANVRKNVGAQEGYYGNCVMTRQVAASSGTIVNGDVMDLVQTVRRAKRDGAVPDQSDVDELLQLDPYNILNVTSWRNIGLEAPDFGGGRPTRVKCHFREWRLPICIACIPCKDEHNVLSTCVKKEHAAAFLHELANMHLK